MRRDSSTLNSRPLQTTQVSNSCFLSCVTLQILDGEMYPPTVKEVGAEMHYPPHVPDSHRFAVGHEAFGLVPGLMMYATIWLREHNRVCDVLKEVHPDWDDERLFQTTRLILIGEFMGVLTNSTKVLKTFGLEMKADIITRKACDVISWCYCSYGGN